MRAWDHSRRRAGTPPPGCRSTLPSERASRACRGRGYGRAEPRSQPARAGRVAAQGLRRAGR
eukprot:scaffold8931_cov65-Phaeocystis_antarctica.AAC.7